MCIITRHEYLHEIRIVELPIRVRVEILNHKVAISFVGRIDAVVSQEVQQFHAADVAIVVAVDPFKRRERFEFFNLRESLSLFLDHFLAFDHEAKKMVHQPLDFALGIAAHFSQIKFNE